VTDLAAWVVIGPPLTAAGAAAEHVVLTGSLLLAMPVALAAGALSFFSPCCLPLVPGYLSYVTGMSGADVARHAGRCEAEPHSHASASAESRPARGRALLGATLFVLGFSAVFVAYGAAFGGLGVLLGRNQQVLTRVLGGLTIALGVMFLGLFARVPWLRSSGRTFRFGYRPTLGLAGAPVVGVLFGLGWTPCIGPTLAAVLALSTTAGTATRGAVLAFTYSLGLGVPLLLVAVAFRRVVRVAGFARRHAQGVMRLGGVLLISVGLLQLTGAWVSLIARLQGLISGTQLPL